MGFASVLGCEAHVVVVFANGDIRQVLLIDGSADAPLELVAAHVVGVEVFAVASQDRLLSAKDEFGRVNRKIWDKHTLDFARLLCTFHIIVRLLAALRSLNLKYLDLAIQSRSHQQIQARVEIKGAHDRPMLVTVIRVHHFLEIKFARFQNICG